MTLEPNDYSFKIEGIEAGHATVRLGYVMCMDTGAVTEVLEGEKTKDPAFGMDAIWLPEERRSEAENAGYVVVDPPTIISTHITEIIRSHAAEMVDRQAVATILDTVKKKNSVLVDEVLNTSKISYGVIEKVFQNLLEEKVSIRNYVKILETMATYAAVTQNNVWALTTKVREALGLQICMQYADPNDKKLRVMRLSQDLSELIAEHAYYPQDGSKPYVAFDPVDRRRWINAVSSSLSKVSQLGYMPIILCVSNVRQLVRSAIEREQPGVVVLSDMEMYSAGSNISVEIIAEIEDEEELTYQELKDTMINIKNKLTKLVNSYKNASIIKDGINVSIIGKPNVGKSSILNHLLDEDKAIVTDIAGTTRDIVEGQININGIILNMIDTAGIRTTDDKIEAIGVEKSKKMMKESDLVLFMLNNNEEITEDIKELLQEVKNKNYLVLINKVDLESKLNLKELDIDDTKIIRMSIKNNQGLEELKEKLSNLLDNAIEDSGRYTLYNEVNSYNIDEVKLSKYLTENYLDDVKYILKIRKEVDNDFEKAFDEFEESVVRYDVSKLYEFLCDKFGYEADKNISNFEEAVFNLEEAEVKSRIKEFKFQQGRFYGDDRDLAGLYYITKNGAKYGDKVFNPTAAKEKLNYLRKNYPEFTWGVQKTN